MKSAPHLSSAQLEFGDQTEIYKAQAVNYRERAIDCAKAYPLLASGAPPGVVTKSEIQAVHEVVAKWLDVVEKLKAIANK